MRWTAVLLCVWLAGCAALQGEQGPPGESGADGAAGAKGDQGDEGDQGEQGDQGEPGMVDPTLCNLVEVQDWYTAIAGCDEKTEFVLWGAAKSSEVTSPIPSPTSSPLLIFPTAGSVVLTVATRSRPSPTAVPTDGMTIQCPFDGLSWSEGHIVTFFQHFLVGASHRPGGFRLRR
ncbi:MAG: hypothetical protein HN348_23680 [Proteobacteria bacterium]|jgi:hypothetical protein|nr:hypothetical protein [Pseudomonadota bacterium]